MRKQIIPLALGLLLTPAALSETPEIEDTTYTCDIVEAFETAVGGAFTTYDEENGRLVHVRRSDGRFRSHESSNVSAFETSSLEITFSDNGQVLLYRGAELRLYGSEDYRGEGKIF